MTDRITEFEELEHAGMTAAQIATRMRVSVRTVSRWRTATGMNHQTPTVRTPDDVRDRARRMIETGCSFTDVADTIGVTAQTVRRWFPDLPAWSKSQAGSYGQLMRRFERIAA